MALFILLATSTGARMVATDFGDEGRRHPRSAERAVPRAFDRLTPARLNPDDIVHVAHIAIDAGIVAAFNWKHRVPRKTYHRKLLSNRIVGNRSIRHLTN
jgi:hypothetical protein